MDTEKVWAMFWMVFVIGVCVMIAVVNRQVQEKELKQMQAGFQMKKTGVLFAIRYDC